MKKNTVVVIGSYNTDLTIKTGRIPRPGETVIGGIFSEGGGGKGANQAVAAVRAGAQVGFIARVGNDALGKQGMERLAEEKIDIRHVIHDPDVPTGVAFIVVDERGENSIVVASGANARLLPSDISMVKEEITSASVLLVQLESPLETVRRAIEVAHAHGVTVILNPAPAQPLDIDLLKAIDIITPNKVEAEMITGIKVTDDQSLRMIAQKFFSFGIKHVLLTLGSKGIFAGIAPDRMEHIPAYTVRSVDSTGAGDVFSGSLAAFLAEGMPVEKAARLANASASISVTRMGAQKSAPRRAEIEQFVKSSVSTETELIQ
jgi:ribokinase